MRTIKNVGTKCVMAAVTMGLVASAAFADVGNIVNVTLPEAVTVGNATLESGSYELTEYPVASGTSVFVIRSEHGGTVASVTAAKDADPGEVRAPKTEIVLTPDTSGRVHLDKLFIEGENAGYRFMDVK